MSTSVENAVRRPEGRPVRHRRTALPLVSLVAAAGLLGVALAAACALAPAAGVVLLVGLPVAWWLVVRLQVAVAVLAASFFFDGYLATSTSLLSPSKLVGALACASFGYHVLVRRRPVVLPPLTVAVAALAVWLPLSMAFAHDQEVGRQVALRYLMLFVLCFLVLQAVAGDRRTVDLMVDVMTAAAALSAALGLYEFLLAGAERAKGPVEDPNDFAFLLAMVVPVIVYRIRWNGGRLGAVLRVLALAVVFACILATFSRGGLVALAAAGAFAVLTRRLALRWALLALALMVLVGLAAFLTSPETVTEALDRKQHVASSNIDTRYTTWALAVEQFASSPVLGVGPGNFESRYWEFALPYDLSGPPPPPHNAYLHVLAELGAPGLAMFLLYLLLGWLALTRRSGDPRTQALLSGLAAGFVVAGVGAVFLSEQYYAPFWVLPALGATLAVREHPPGGAAPARAVPRRAAPVVAVGGGPR
ncbi:O-antigen ligase family protein [Kineococcus sp. SYSU DK006]|uniref:O-antigen ligase family protein n=1 Tax=Kineococcus sp. SYSU DK006 TaxID=3383127 RepID=UPI003D7C6D24